MANDLVDEDFEGGSNGNTITTANTTADAVVGTAPTFTTTALVGSLASDHNPSAAQSMYRFDHANATDAWYVFRLRLTALPSVITYMSSFYSASDVTKIGDLRVNTDGTLAIRNNNTAVATTTTALSTNTWYKIALHVVPNTTNGLRIKLYNSSGTLLEEVAGNSTQNASIGVFRVGNSTSTTLHYQVDHVEGSSTAEPSAGDTTAPTAVVSLTSKNATYNSSDTLTACTFSVTAASSTDNVGVTGYSWSDNSAGGSFSSTTVAAPTYTPPDLVSGPWQLTCTVSDAATNSDSASINVDVPASGGAASPIAGIAFGVSGAAI